MRFNNPAYKEQYTDPTDHSIHKVHELSFLAQSIVATTTSPATNTDAASPAPTPATNTGKASPPTLGSPSVSTGLSPAPSPCAGQYATQNCAACKANKSCKLCAVYSVRLTRMKNRQPSCANANDGGMCEPEITSAVQLGPLYIPTLNETANSERKKDPCTGKPYEFSYGNGTILSQLDSAVRAAVQSFRFCMLNATTAGDTVTILEQEAKQCLQSKPKTAESTYCNASSSLKKTKEECQGFTSAVCQMETGCEKHWCASGLVSTFK